MAEEAMKLAQEAMTQIEELKRFEQWWDAEDDIPNNGPYTPDTPIQFAWAGWQAALAEQPAQPIIKSYLEKDNSAQRCKYGYELTSCTRSPMDCQCALDVVFEQPAQQEPVGCEGAVVNGRVYADRLEHDYKFECEAGPLHLCTDWVEFRRCFEWLAQHTSPPAQRTWVGLTSQERDAQRWRFLMENSYDSESVTQFHVWEHSWEPHSQTGAPTEWKQRVHGIALIDFIDRAIEAAHGIKENT